MVVGGGAGTLSWPRTRTRRLVLFPIRDSARCRGGGWELRCGRVVISNRTRRGLPSPPPPPVHVILLYCVILRLLEVATAGDKQTRLRDIRVRAARVINKPRNALVVKTTRRGRGGEGEGKRTRTHFGPPAVVLSSGEPVKYFRPKLPGGVA